MLLEEARPVCPEDADATSTSAQHRQHLPGREEKQRPPAGPGAALHIATPDLVHTCQPRGQRGLNSGPAVGQGVPTSVPPQLLGKQEREGRMQSASGNRHRGPGAVP